MDATTSETITGFANMNDGDVVDLSNVGTRNLVIRINTNPGTVGSVIIKLNGTQVKVENITADTYNFSSTMLQGGNFTLEAIPYTNINGGGSVGTKKSVSFRIQD